MAAETYRVEATIRCDSGRSASPISIGSAPILTDIYGDKSYFERK